MSEHIDPVEEFRPALDPAELLDQAEDPELGAPSPELLRPNRESLSVTYLNTSFSGAFEHPAELDSLLLRQDQLAQGVREPRENAIFGFSEVTTAQRPAVRAALEERGYQVVEPADDSHLDLIWAVSPQLGVEASNDHHFPRKGLRRVASRTGSDNYRHVGIQDLTVSTPQGNKIRLGQERLSPWLVEPVRRMQLRDMDQVLREQFAPDDDVALTLIGGDMNHVGPFRRPDHRYWEKMRQTEGWEPMLEPGTPTHSSTEKYRRVNWMLQAVRRGDETQLDAVYARPGSGRSLVNTAAAPDAELTPDQIGFTSRTIPVKGTDHYAVETTFSLPTLDHAGDMRVV